MLRERGPRRPLEVAATAALPLLADLKARVPRWGFTSCAVPGYSADPILAVGPKGPKHARERRKPGGRLWGKGERGAGRMKGRRCQGS
jgi:hypothetical protein